ncbi:hypothetical protein BgiBS90_025999 [Biomphalaria glabrata]|nr:hypothetical protein BgiBS90_025999 [Biomphalaria glabrata]
MAKQDNESDPFDVYGDHETQESVDDEAHVDLWTHQCTKNAGHLNYVDIDKLTLEDLPAAHRNDLFMNFVNSAAKLTIKIVVKMTSPNRPEFWPNSNKPFPSYKIRSRTNLRVGSGRIWRVTKYVDGIKGDGRKHCRAYTTCPCKKCRVSKTPSNTWWEITVRTAAHVVYDEIEAEHASCTLFYDEKDSTVLTLDEITVPYINLDLDFARLTCYTCDPEVAGRLTQLQENFNALWGKMCELNTEGVSDEDKCVFVISHPHGTPKKISFGQWKDKIAMTEHDYKFTYTAPTCPGSSGAPVFVLGYSGKSYYHVHSGALKSGLNISGADLVWA